MTRGLSRCLPVAALCVAAALAPALAQDPVEIRFARGTDSAVVEGALARGERGLHAFTARAGQTAALAVMAAEGNAVFQLYAPGAIPAGEGRIEGQALPGAGEGADARAWQGILPASGRYLVVVGALRGGTEYQLSLSIR